MESTSIKMLPPHMHDVVPLSPFAARISFRSAKGFFFLSMSNFRLCFPMITSFSFFPT